MSDFESIEKKLDGWFSKSFHELPSPLKRLVIPSFKPFSWDDLSPNQRRSLTNQRDYQYDPATESHQTYWFDFEAKRQELEDQLREWQLTASPIATDLKQKEDRVGQLKQELAHRDRLEKLLMRRNFPRYAKAESEEASIPKPEKLIGLPLALNRLRERLGASQEEIAAWVFMTEHDGGLRAYKPQYHPEEFQRFYFEPEMDPDYLSLLFNCWFDEYEIANFEPRERFISGAACLEVLEDLNDGAPSVFLSEMVSAGKITDLHPIRGATKVSSLMGPSLPEVESGLFSIDEIENILIEMGAVTPGSLHPQSLRKENETSGERKNRLLAWHEEELARGKKGAVQRTADREGITRQTLSAILKR